MAKDRFEDAMNRLEEIVHRMETGELSLDESLKAFEEGIKLARFCSKKLEEAEKRIELLVRDEQGELSLAPFAGDNHEA
ncbi:MAG: exodeoxyribonuclease VII small subunit [Syntrophales bacterium]|nr:exodeoxyribonuclease VII small subunit [Syntrophales bacterium]